MESYDKHNRTANPKTLFCYFLILKTLCDEFPVSAPYISVLMTRQPQALSIVIKE